MTLGLIFVLLLCGGCRSAYPESAIILKQMMELSEDEATVTASEAFGFDFDKAYIPDSRAVYADKDYYLKIMNVKSKINILQFPSEEYRRILFVKNNTIVYDFIYSEQQLQLSEDDAWFFSNTHMSFSWLNSSNRTIHISFDDRIEG